MSCLLGLASDQRTNLQQKTKTKPSPSSLNKIKIVDLVRSLSDLNIVKYNQVEKLNNIMLFNTFETYLINLASCVSPRREWMKTSVV